MNIFRNLLINPLGCIQFQFMNSYMYKGGLNKSGTYSSHRTGAVSSRTSLTDRSGSHVPPGHSLGHIGR